MYYCFKLISNIIEEIVSRKHISPLKTSFHRRPRAAQKSHLPHKRIKTTITFPIKPENLQQNLPKTTMKQDYYFQPWLQKHQRTMHSPTLPLVSTGIKQSPITRARSLRQSRVKKKKKNFYSTRRVFHLRSGPPPSLRPPIKRNSNATNPLAIPTLLETPEFARRSFLFFFFSLPTLRQTAHVGINKSTFSTPSPPHCRVHCFHSAVIVIHACRYFDEQIRSCSLAPWKTDTSMFNPSPFFSFLSFFFYFFIHHPLISLFLSTVSVMEVSWREWRELHCPGNGAPVDGN